MNENRVIIILIIPQKIACFVTLTKNAHIDKYKHFRYGGRFDGKITFSCPSGGFGCNVIVLCVDMSSCINADNKKKDILIYGEGPMKELNDLTLIAEKKY